MVLIAEDQREERKMTSITSTQAIVANHTMEGWHPPRSTKRVQGLSEYLGATSLQTFERGQTICFEGDPCERVFQVVTGLVKLFKMTLDGRIQIVDFAQPGDFIGLGDTDGYGLTAEVAVGTQLRSWKRNKLDTLIAEDQRAARLYSSEAAREISRAREQILLLGRKEAIERIAWFLLTEMRRQGASEEDGACVDLPMTRQDIGGFLGLSMETVSRAFSRLKRAGIIETKCISQVEVLDVEQLESVAEGASVSGCAAH
jgi:CRP/FNR family transcriptional regulator, anaerobic regulatory protein